MSIVRRAYIAVTIGIVSLFLALYFASGQEFCLLPVVLVIWDFIREVYKTTPYQAVAVEIPRDDPRSPYYVHPIYKEPERVPLFTDLFIKEEEFKV
jgi:hypothetical protein